MKKKLLSLLFIIISFFIFLPDVAAASLSISASSKTVVNGNTVTITVKASGLAGKFSITSSNGNVLSGGTNSVWLENETKTYKFTAKSIGDSTITVKTLDVADSSGKVYSKSQSIKISVVKPREKSNNNNLKSLSVEGYSISPSFNKNTLEYTVNLESNVEKIKINASKEDGYASISGTGEKVVQEGDNKFEITVTSETGKSKVYIVNAVVKDSNPIVKEIDGKSYTVIKRASALVKPDAFPETMVLVNGIEIPAFYNEITNITLIGLKDENGVINLYKYNTEDESCVKFETLTSKVMTVIFKNTDEVIEGYSKTTVTIDDVEYNAYQHDDNKEYVLVYGTLLETGEDGWYLYNIKEKSIQTYIGDFISNMQSNFNNELDEYKVALLGMAGLSLLLLVIIIIQIIFKNKMKKKFLKRLQLKKETVQSDSKVNKPEKKIEVKEENKKEKDVSKEKIKNEKEGIKKEKTHKK